MNVDPVSLMNAARDLESARQAYRRKLRADAELSRLERYASLSPAMRRDRAGWLRELGDAERELRRVLGQATPLPDDVSILEDGDADCYTLLHKDRWIASVLLNGELLVERQREVVRAMAQAVAAVNP